MTDYLSELNSAQRSAVTHDISATSRPLLVIAGAGSGKTATLAHRVAHLICQGVDPNRILLLTFSRRAAEEMLRRARGLIFKISGDKDSNNQLSWAGTFHSVGVRLIREYASQTGLNPNFSILDRSDAADLMDIVRHDADLHLKEKRFPQKNTCLSIYSRVANGRGQLADILEEHFPWCTDWTEELHTLFKNYVDAKQKTRSLDFDDLLLYWASMMSVPELAEAISRRFDHVLVDEYQDVNDLQASILLNLRPTGQGLTVVGDDAQSIYAFRCADVRNILKFPSQFSPEAKVITLDRNYRSTQPILDASNAVIGLAKSRFTKNLWTSRHSTQKPRIVIVRNANDQADYIAGRILEAREAGASLRQLAVLFRASHHSAVLEVELTRRNIPFRKYGGLRFLDTQHVKDIVAVLRLCENPHDRVAGFRVLQILPGVGPKTAGRILDAISSEADPFIALEHVKPSATSKEEWLALLSMFTQVNQGRFWPSGVDAVRKWYAPYLEQRHDDAKARMADLQQLAQIAEGYPTRTRFLTDLALDPPDASSDEAANPSLDDDYMTLSTIHSAKGKEWAEVFVLNMVDGCIPSDLGVGSENEIEEERRLLYVALTRAKDQLHLMAPQQWHVHGQMALGDRHVYAARSRFIPDSILTHFEQTTWASTRRDQYRPPQLPPGLIDLAAVSRGRWN